ncbi:MAG: hypothetical protein MJZ13_03275 [Bacteroidales bacterium]|nr:hypothetical protein [Bacteroidales bacterium]
MKPLFQITVASAATILISGCMSTGSISNNAMNDDLYYGGTRQLSLGSSSNPKDQVSTKDIDSYNQRVNSYSTARYANAPAGDSYANDERDFSAIQEYYSAENDANLDANKGEKKYLVQVNDSTFMEAQEADGIWLGGFKGSDYDRDYAERIIKFHSPLMSISYYEPAMYYLQYSPDWNTYIDSYGYAHIIPSWTNPWYDDYYYGGFSWNWGWSHHHHHFGFGWNWGYSSYAWGWNGWYDPWYYGGGWYGYHGYYGYYGYGHHHHHHYAHHHHGHGFYDHSYSRPERGGNRGNINSGSRNANSARNIAAQQRYSRGNVSQYTAAENRERSVRSYTRTSNTSNRNGNATTTASPSRNSSSATSSSRTSSTGSSSRASSATRSDNRASGNVSRSSSNRSSYSGSSTSRSTSSARTSSSSSQRSSGYSSGSSSRSSHSSGSSSRSYNSGSSHSSSSSRSSFSGGGSSSRSSSGGGATRSSGGGGRSGGGRR